MDFNNSSVINYFNNVINELNMGVTRERFYAIRREAIVVRDSLNVVTTSTETTDKLKLIINQILNQSWKENYDN